MKTWMLLAATALAPMISFAQELPELAANRAALVQDMEANRTALLPQSEPLTPLTARYQPRLDDLKKTALEAKTATELTKTKKDFLDWKAAVLREAYGDSRREPGTETFAAFSARRTKEAEFVASLRQQFAAQRTQDELADFHGALQAPDGMGSSWSHLFDNQTPASAAPTTFTDGAVKTDAPAGAARYAKLRGIAVHDWKASPKIVDAAIAEAMRQGVDPALVLSVIWQESRFNTHATSPVGARGLMQVMPDTGRGLGVSNPNMLYDMKTNLRAGVRYLRNAASYLKLNIDLSDISEAPANKIKALLASYNAGCGAVSKWLRQQGSDLVRIPYAETRHYVRVISAKLASLGEYL